ncbi:hypothetical protein CRG98_003716 [Punica granatum]|uniref:Uncharacterized protein n=1 Tax=Punica granatum TaxID=22663 RepID=A0A2I0L5B7_PUNGR|nr:hypothetical protein CRG98_003716 [Punica granatum]
MRRRLHGPKRAKGALGHLLLRCGRELQWVLLAIVVSPTPTLAASRHANLQHIVKQTWINREREKEDSGEETGWRGRLDVESMVGHDGSLPLGGPWRVLESWEVQTRLETGKELGDPNLEQAGTVCWRLQTTKLTPLMDLGDREQGGYIVCLRLDLSRVVVVGKSGDFLAKLALLGLVMGFWNAEREWPVLIKEMGHGRQDPPFKEVDGRDGCGMVDFVTSVTNRNQRRPENLYSEFSHCFPSVLMCPKTTVFFVCRKRIPKICWGTFETLLEPLGKPR